MDGDEDSESGRLLSKDEDVKGFTDILMKTHLGAAINLVWPSLSHVYRDVFFLFCLLALVLGGVLQPGSNKDPHVLNKVASKLVGSLNTTTSVGALSVPLITRY